MDSTFKFKQNLSSKEFGLTFYHTVPKGVLKEPYIFTIENKTIKMAGGEFILYNGAQSYAIRLSLGEDYSSSTQASDSDVGKYIFLKYTYTQYSEGTLSLSIHPLDLSDVEKYKEDYIRLARIYTDSDNNFQIDYCFEYCALKNFDYEENTQSKEYAQNIVSFISYNIKDTSQKVVVYLTGSFLDNENNKIITNPFREITTITYGEGIGDSIEANGEYYLFLDSTATIQLCKNSTPRFNKLILAEKYKNGNFAILDNPILINQSLNNQSLKNFSIDTSRPNRENWRTNPGVTPAKYSIKDMTDVIEETTNTNTKETGFIALLKSQASLIDTLINICNDQESRIKVLENKCLALGANEIISNKNYVNVSNVRIHGIVDTDTQSSFGTSSRPIKNLYVSGVLSTDNLTLN